jgi:hypothetical protein
MPFLRSGKNIVQEPIQKKKKKEAKELEVFPKEEIKEEVSEVKETVTVLEEVKEVPTEVVTVLEEVKDIVKEVKEVEEFIEIKELPILNQTSKKSKGYYSCNIC